MKLRLYIISALVYSMTAASSAFNPVPGTPLWGLIGEVGAMTNAIGGTQERIQQSSLIAGGYTISTPGRYALVEDITVSSSISVNTSDVYLDLNGFTITNSNASAVTIDVLYSLINITIVNGTLSGGQVGLRIQGLSPTPFATNVCLEDLQVVQVTGHGIQIGLGGPGVPSGPSTVSVSRCVLSQIGGSDGMVIFGGVDIYITDSVFTDMLTTATALNILDSSSNVVVERCTFENNANEGIVVVGNAHNVVIAECTFMNHGFSSVALQNTSNIAISDCYFTKALRGISASTCTNVQVENVYVCDVVNSGFLFQTPLQLNLISCTAHACGNNGFSLSDPGNILMRGCVSSGNGSTPAPSEGAGFLVVGGAGGASPVLRGIVIEDCHAMSNSGYGFALGRNIALRGIVVRQCSASNNGAAGFSCSLFNGILDRNSSTGNGSSNFEFYNGTDGGPTASCGKIVVQDCIANNPGTGGNFAEAGVNQDFANIYLGCSASALADASNWTGGGPSVPLLASVSSTSTAGFPTSTRWANLSITLT